MNFNPPQQIPLDDDWLKLYADDRDKYNRVAHAGYLLGAHPPPVGVQQGPGNIWQGVEYAPFRPAPDVNRPLPDVPAAWHHAAQHPIVQHYFQRNGQFIPAEMHGGNFFPAPGPHAHHVCDGHCGHAQHPVGPPAPEPAARSAPKAKKASTNQPSSAAAGQQPAIQEVVEPVISIEVELPTSAATAIRNNQIVVNVKESFEIHSDISWPDMAKRLCSKMKISLEDIETGGALGYRLSGDAKKDISALETDDHFRVALQKVTSAIKRARTKTPTLVIVNRHVPAAVPKKGAVPLTASHAKKRKADAEAAEEANGIAAYGEPAWKYLKLLRSTKWCNKCNAWCFIDNDGNHVRKTLKDLEYWAKQISVGAATLNTPPNQKHHDYQRSNKKPRRALADTTNTPTFKREPPDVFNLLDSDDDSIIFVKQEGIKREPLSPIKREPIKREPMSPFKLARAVSVDITYPTLSAILPLWDAASPGLGFDTLLDALTQMGLRDVEDIITVGVDFIAKHRPELPRKTLTELHHAACMEKEALLEAEQAKMDNAVIEL